MNALRLAPLLLLACAHRMDPRKAELLEISLKRSYASSYGEPFEVIVDGDAFQVHPWVEEEPKPGEPPELRSTIIDQGGAQIECRAVVYRTRVYGTPMSMLQYATMSCESRELPIELEIDGPQLYGEALVGDRSLEVAVSASVMTAPSELLLEQDGLAYLFVSWNGRIWIDPDLGKDHRAMLLVATAMWTSLQNTY